MPRKTTPPFHVAPLQRVVAEPITDPAEQRALDELCKKSRPRTESALCTESSAKGPKKVARTLDLCSHLSAQELCMLVAQLAAQLSADGQQEVLASILVQLSSKAIRQLEQEVQSRLGKHAV